MSIKIQKVVILRSSDLLHRKGKSDAHGYTHSRHQEGLASVEEALKNVSAPYEYLDEDDFRSTEELIDNKSPKIIIVPEMRTCGEDTFQKLKDYADRGWTIFAMFDSFYYKSLEGKDPKRVITVRMQDLFQLSNIISAETEANLKNIEISFPVGRYSWLTTGLQPIINYQENTLVGVIANSSVLIRHGDITGTKITKDPLGKETQTKSSYPAFLIREFDNGGLFIYATFLLRKIENFQLVFKNIYLHKVSKKNTGQYRSLTWVVIIQAVVIGLLVARDFMSSGNPWTTQIGAALIGGIVGWLVTKATSLFDNLLKNN